MENLKDDQLIDRYRQGEVEALGQLYDRYGVKLYGYFIRLTGSRNGSEDLLQETFCRLIEKLDRYQPRGQFKAFLFRMAHNLAVDRMRAWKFRDESDSLDKDRQNKEDFMTGQSIKMGLDCPDPAEETEKMELEARLREAIDQLPPEQRQVLVMKHYTDLTFREVAEAVGIPLNTALGRMHYAILNLRKFLSDLF